MINALELAVWMRRGRRTALGLVVVLVLYGVLGYFVAPGLIKSVAEQQIAEALGRQATIGAVHVDPYLLAATLDDFKLYQPDGTTVAVDVKSLTVDLSSASLLKRALVIDRLVVGTPVIHIARVAAQRFDFSDIVDRLAAKPKSDDPFLFSLNNIEVDGGSITVDDRVGGRRHVIDAIHIGLPFLSNLPYDTAIFVTPSFSARVDGSTFRLTGKTQPFSAAREATLAFEVVDLDLADYADLAPTTLPLKLASGKLSTKLALVFRAAGEDAAGNAVAQSVALSGHVGLAGLALATADGHRALGADAIDVDITKLDPFDGGIAIADLTIRAPDVDVMRRADGSIDLVALFQPPQTADPKATATKPAATAPAPFTIARLSIAGGRVRFVDQALAQPATTTLSRIDAQVAALALHGTAPASYRLSLVLDDGPTAVVEGHAIVDRKQVDGTLDVHDFRPAGIAPYLAGFVAARIDAASSVDVHARYRIDASGARLVGLVDDASVHVSHLKATLPDDKTALLAADAVALDGARFDLATRAFTAESLSLTAPVVAIRRDAKGRLNLADAIVAAPVARPVAAAAGSTQAGVEPALEIRPAAAAPFTAAIRQLSITRGDVTLEDLSNPVPLRVRAQPLDVSATNVGTALDASIPFEITTGVDQRGKLAVKGKLTVAPLALDATIDASQVAVGWLAAFAGERLNIAVDSADLDTKGTLRVAAGRTGAGESATPSVTYRGSARVTRMRTRDRVTSEPFVQWKTLDVPMLDVRMPTIGAPSFTLGTVTLSDFYARVIVNASGRLNLQNVFATTAGKQSVTTAETTATPAVAPTAASTGPKPVIHVAGIQLAGGRIGITDNFIKPNYSADLTDLAGQIATIASDDPKPAALKLAGRIDGEGTLDVHGSIDPLAATSYTDIEAQAKDIELTRLTPYALKYAGYAIERGKLSTTVRYHIENGRLQATNKLFLDQLAFGAHDPNSSANLPVRLAVALLANAKGEIDIELPISGSLSDPQFSVGGVLWGAFLNLIARAATSPFALIGSAFGGAANGELGYIQFKPGLSDLTDLGKTKLETLARALAERPGLKLDIIGRYDPATDPDGIKRDHLLDRLKDLKAKDQSKGDERVGRDDVTIAPGVEYDAYLARLYDDTKLPDKPRNAIGLAKTIPPAEMEQRLLAGIALDPSDPRWLAEARADVVRHTIEGTGKISAGRVFLVTPKLDANGITDQGVPNRVDFALR